jgi:hypothetical protein
MHVHAVRLFEMMIVSSSGKLENAFDPEEMVEGIRFEIT